MKIRKLWFLGSLTVFFASLIMLVSGTPFLEKSMSQTRNIPVGTLTTWLGMIALPLSVYWGTKHLRQPDTRFRTFLSIFLKCLIILGILWVPICYLLSGNIAFNFSEVEGFQGGQSAMRWFWRYSYGLPIATIVLLLTYWITALVNSVRRNS